MRRIGIISNPGSHRNLRGMTGLREMIEGDADLIHAETDEMADLPEILADFARREVGLILINGGDGTTLLEDAVEFFPRGIQEFASARRDDV